METEFFFFGFRAFLRLLSSFLSAPTAKFISLSLPARISITTSVHQSSAFDYENPPAKGDKERP